MYGRASLDEVRSHSGDMDVISGKYAYKFETLNFD